MLRYKTQTRPGLVALYEIQPGNGAGLFLNPEPAWGPLSMSSNSVLTDTEISDMLLIRIHIYTPVIFI